MRVAVLALLSIVQGLTQDATPVFDTFLIITTITLWQLPACTTTHFPFHPPWTPQLLLPLMIWLLVLPSKTTATSGT